MARESTVTRVHAAVVDLAVTRGPAALTMEGIAAAAGVGKQTLYRSWPSSSAVLFDALLALSPAPDPDADADHVEDQRASATDRTGTSARSRARDQLVHALVGAVEEIHREPHQSLLRRLAADIQTDVAIADEYRTRLFEPQSAQFRELAERAGARDADRVVDVLLGPVFQRWFLRLDPPSEVEITRSVEDALTLDRLRRPL